VDNSLNSGQISPTSRRSSQSSRTYRTAANDRVRVSTRIINWSSMAAFLESIQSGPFRRRCSGCAWHTGVERIKNSSFAHFLICPAGAAALLVQFACRPGRLVSIGKTSKKKKKLFVPFLRMRQRHPGAFACGAGLVAAGFDANGREPTGAGSVIATRAVSRLHPRQYSLSIRQISSSSAHAEVELRSAYQLRADLLSGQNSTCSSSSTVHHHIARVPISSRQRSQPWRIDSCECWARNHVPVASEKLKRAR